MKFKRHNSIVENTIEYPYKYRLVNPFITQAYFLSFKLFVSEKASFLLAYALQNFLVYLFLCFAVTKFFGLWFDENGVVISLLLFVMLIPLSLTGYDVLGDMLTAGLMALGFYFIVQSKTFFLYPIVFIGAFNELQIIILIVVYLLSKNENLKNPKIWMNSFGLLVTFAIAYSIIYVFRGGQAGGEEVKWYFTKDAAYNLAHPDFILLWAVMIIPLLVFALIDFKLKPEFLKRTFLFILPVIYIFAFFFIARMREIDKALTIFIILIPLAIHSLHPRFIKQNSVQN